MGSYHQGAKRLWRTSLWLPLTFLIVAGVQPLQAEQNITAIHSILAITNNDYPYSNTAIAKASASSLKLLNLDSAHNLEAQLSQNLPTNKALAEAKVKQHIATIGEAQFSQQLRAAYEPMIAAMRYGIDRYPAVIFDGGKAVVYGVTDLRAALNHYAHWLAAQQGGAVDE